jgi:hypothetical protein
MDRGCFKGQRDGKPESQSIASPVQAAKASDNQPKK